jgi:hypothetical protein
LKDSEIQPAAAAIRVRSVTTVGTLATQIAPTAIAGAHECADLRATRPPSVEPDATWPLQT